MAELEGIPQWMRELRQRRRAGAQPGTPAGGQSVARRAPAVMLLQSPAAYDIGEHLDYNEEGSATERSTPLRDEDYSEELTYGPGIVKKLKSRYLNLTLREAQRTRPSIHGLRRATSLEHVLEDTKPAPPPRKYQPNTASGRPTRYRQPTRTPEAVRRARSVDALARCDSRSETEEPLSPAGPESPVSYTREPPVSPGSYTKDPPPSPISYTREPPPSPIGYNREPLPSPTLRPKRPSPLLKETERPPPDLVKTALKIFEGQPGKKLRTPSTGQVADKVKSFSDNQVKGKKTNGARLQRPAISPRPLLSPDHKPVTISTQTTPSLLSRPPPSPKKIINHKPTEDRDRSVSPVYVIRHPVILAPVETSPAKTDYLPKSVKPLEFKSPEPSPRNSLLKSPDSSVLHDKLPLSERNGKDTPDETNVPPYARTSTPDPEIVTQPAATEISLIAPAIPYRQRHDSDRQTSDSSSGDEGVFEVNGDEPPVVKYVSTSALENIAKAGNTTHYSFNNSNGFSDKTDGKSYLPSAKNTVVLNKIKPIDNDFKTNVPDIPFSNISLASYPTTVIDAKLIAPLTPLIIPKYTIPVPEDSVPSLTTKKSDVTKAPASPPRDRLLTALKHSKDIESSPGLVHYNSPSPPQLTSREIEKNFINTSKSLEQPVKKVTVSMIDSPEKKGAKENADKVDKATPQRVETKSEPDVDSVILVDVKEIVTVKEVVSSCDVMVKESKSVESSVSISNGLGPRVGGKKPPWRHQENTTMLFDFSNRKGVPDYIENDGLTRRTNRREKPKVGVDVISLDGLGGETCTDTGAGSDSGDEDWARRPPSPCDVAFENDNVLINGRSNMSAGKPRARHLKIQFDESLTRTFEYPSEASLGEEPLINTASPTSPMAVGGSLSTYTPSKVSLQSDSFQLGVTRTQSQPGAEKSNGNSSATNANGDSASSLEESSSGANSSTEGRMLTEDYLIPCQEDQSHNWSHETHIGAGDLLF